MFCLAVIVMSSSNFTLGVDRQIACCWNLIASHLVRTQCKAKAKMQTLFKPSRLWDCVPSIHLSSGGQDMSDFTEHLIYLQLQQPVWPMDLVYLVLTFILFYFSYFLCLSVCVKAKVTKQHLSSQRTCLPIFIGCSLQNLDVNLYLH